MTGKSDLRRAARDARRAMPEPIRRDAATRLAVHAASLFPGPGREVACYLSMATEPGTDALIAAARPSGLVVWLPRIAGADLQWVRTDEATVYAPGPMGIREPVGPASEADVLSTLSVIFLPGLAVDRQGHRLGQGGGFYDRALADITPHAAGGPLLVAVVFDDEVHEVIPVEAHDHRVNAAVTPERIVRFDRGEFPLSRG